MFIRPSDERYKINAVRLGRVIDIKNMAEYEELLVFHKEAEKALKDCGRFLAFVRAELLQSKKSWVSCFRSIDLSPIPDLIDLNNTPRIVNRIHNPVIPLP